MAFTFCENCGEKIDIQDSVCPHCGYKRGGEYVPPEREHNYSYENESEGAEPLWKTPNGNQNQHGGAPHGGMYTPPPYNSPYGQYPPFGQRRMPQKRPISKGLAVFSAINMCLGLFCLVGLIFGALALAQAVSAQNAFHDADEINRKKTSLVLNIIGICLTVLNIAAVIVGFILAGAAANPLAFVFMI